MNLADMASAHQQLRQILQHNGSAWDLDDIITAGLETETRTHDNAAAAWSALLEIAPSSGWLQWQSHQTDFQQVLPTPETGWGVLLAAEAVVSENESLKLDYLQGCWQLTRYRHIDDRQDYLCDSSRLLLHGAQNRYLRYRRYWQIDEQQGAIQLAAVLTAID